MMLNEPPKAVGKPFHELHKEHSLKAYGGHGERVYGPRPPHTVEELLR